MPQDSPQGPAQNATNESTGQNQSGASAPKVSRVTKAAGSGLALLPGESGEEYEQGLMSAIQELGAKTGLQVYLAEKIFQSLWWMRRYETQKRTLVIKAMVDILIGPVGQEDKRLTITGLFMANDFDSPRLEKLYTGKGLTPESLLGQAMFNRQEKILGIDQQIALRTKTLVSLQQSYEALVNRPVLQERLRLQNDLLKQDLLRLNTGRDLLVAETGTEGAQEPDTKSRAELSDENAGYAEPESSVSTQQAAQKTVLERPLAKKPKKSTQTSTAKDGKPRAKSGQ